MSSHPDLPPNPREARYRRPPLHWAAYPVTLALIVISFIVAALSQLGSKDARVSALFFREPPLVEFGDGQEFTLENLSEFDGTDSPEVSLAKLRVMQALVKHGERSRFADITTGQVWRLFTPMFLHFGAMHLIFNMMVLWEFGRLLESRFGAWRYLLLALGISLAANVTQALVSGTNFGGMSGVNYGLFGFIFVRQTFHPAGDIRLNPQTAPYMFIWLIICFTGYAGPIANGAHVAGLVAGAAAGWVNSMMGGGWALIKRRREFQRSMDRSASTLHQCAVCKRTERDDPNLEFRVAADEEEYCVDHLPGRNGS